MTSLALVAALALTASPQDPLASCSEQKSRPGELKLKCDGFELAVSIEHPAAAETAILESSVNALKQNPRLAFQPSELTLDGAVRHGGRVTELDSKGKLLATGLAAVVPSAAPDRVRFALCTEPKAQRCPAALEAFAARLKSTPIAAPVATGAPDFSGRALDVPQGCTFALEGPRSMIRCNQNGANVSWSELDGNVPSGLDWFYEPTKKSLAQMGTLTDGARACLVDGVETPCRHAKVQRTQDVLLVTVGEAKVRGKRMLVQCNVVARGDGSEALPSPCLTLLKWK